MNAYSQYASLAFLPMLVEKAPDDDLLREMIGFAAGRPRKWRRVRPQAAPVARTVRFVPPGATGNETGTG